MTTMTTTTTINVAKDFSKYPGGRYLSDGDYSGQRFRDEMLVPALRSAQNTKEKLTVELDGTLGYGSSFLEEAFGGLVREAGFSADELKGVLVLDTTNNSLRYTILDFISKAKSK